MKPREVIDRTTTPDNECLELAREGDYYVIRVAGVPLMSNRTTGSEEAMAAVAAQALGNRPRPRVLVGGLGMGFTLRAVLDQFGPDARVTVAELLPAIVSNNRGVLGPLAKHPLKARRVRLFEGDVRVPLAEGGWDAVLLDLDNGPDAFTWSANAGIYDDSGVALIAGALRPGGVVIIWSANPDRLFERRVRRAGLSCETRKVYARGAVRKGGRHYLFVARARH